MGGKEKVRGVGKKRAYFDLLNIGTPLEKEILYSRNSNIS